MAGRNPNWTDEELILALDLYFRHNPLHISASHSEVIALSKILNRLPIHANRPDPIRFRNPTGVYMKLCNFLRFDESYHGVGLSRGARAEEQIWKEYAEDPICLRQAAAAIRLSYVHGMGAAGGEPDL